MELYARKKYLILPPPTEDNFTADRERLLTGLGEPASLSLPALQELYPTLHRADYKVTVTLSPSPGGWEIIHVEPGNTTNRLYGAALDIGSTTLQLELLNLHTGRTLTSAGCTNSQIQVGDNILDRIFYAKDEPEHLRQLQEQILEDIRGLLDRCCEASGVASEQIAGFTVGGNTTMIHFLLGCEPWLVFQQPYAPAFFDPGLIPARELGLPLRCSVCCIPAVANYLGGDIVSGLLMTDLDTREDLAIFLDVGTNGELALGCKDFLLVGAGAAGPALEGGVSKSGMRAEPGAICSVQIDAANQLHYQTIGGEPPRGICGSGIVDLLAEGYLSGWISGDGTLNPDASEQIGMVWDKESRRQIPAIFYAGHTRPALCFTQKDIGEFIKCKAAAHTMVATMLGSCNVGLDQIGTFYLSGGFGTHLNLESAITIGLYPDIPREKFEILGNSSLSGAKKLLLDGSCRERIRNITQAATYVQFGAMDRFLENMVAAQFIPHTDASLYPSVKRRK